MRKDAALCGDGAPRAVIDSDSEGGAEFFVRRARRAAD